MKVSLREPLEHISDDFKHLFINISVLVTGAIESNFMRHTEPLPKVYGIFI